MLHHSQLVVWEQAVLPVKRENLSFVERASFLFLTVVQDVCFN
ncbi:hypothetical protein [Microcoleus sp. LEGE 07076]|nr:hypothetical protein [Microcoleus sp. LEGE 07076]